MRQEILEYLNTQRVGVLAVEMFDGSPHGATLHFAYVENPLQFFFKTHREYRKSEPLLKKSTTRATFVVGVDESNMKTLQLDGQVRVITQSEKELFDSVYLGKFPEKRKNQEDPHAVYFVFIPTWWRYTDWHTPQGKLIINSDQHE